MRMPRPHPLNGPAQGNVRQIRVAVGRAAGLDYFQRVALEGLDLYRKHVQAALARPTTTQRHRCRAILYAPRTKPEGTTLDPTGRVNQLTDGSAFCTRDRFADVFAFNGHAAKCIIRDGNGDWYCAFRFSRRCGCGDTRTSLFNNPENVTVQLHQCKRIVHTLIQTGERGNENRERNKGISISPLERE